MKRITALAWLSFWVSTSTLAQNVGIGTATPHSSAALEISSTTKGTLITSMTTTQRKAIANPATGLLVFDINKKTIYLYDGNQWLPMLYSSYDKNSPVMTAPANLPDNALFGYKVAIDGDYAIVGVPRANAGLTLDAGAAYIFHRNNGVWEQQDNVYADDAQTGDYFGASVSISGDYAVVGAHLDDVGANADQGSIYVFKRNGLNWTQQQKLTANDGTAIDFFGYSIAIDSTTIVVGAPRDNIGANADQGSVYIYGFLLFGFAFDAKLTASDGDAGDSFGTSVSVNGNFLAVGAIYDDIGGNANQGSVYSFSQFSNNPQGWSTGQPYHAKISALDGDANDNFGCSVSLGFIFLAVGVRSDDINSNNDQGSVYVYTRLPVPPYNYSSPDKVIAPDGDANDLFGTWVSNSGVHLIIGAPFDDSPFGVLNQGSVYVYSLLGASPSFIRKIEDDPGEAGGNFGNAVGISGYEVIIGAYLKKDGEGQVGFINVQ